MNFVAKGHNDNEIYQSIDPSINNNFANLLTNRNSES